MKNLYWFFKELRDFLAFFLFTKQKEKDVVFYVDDAHHIKFFEGLVDRLTQQDNIRVSYVTSGACDPLLRQQKKNMRVFYIHLLLEPFMLLLKSKMLIVTIPDDIDLFKLKSSQKVGKYIYLFHTLGSIFHLVRPKGIYNYDVIFCAGPHHVRELRREDQLYGRDKPRELIEYGYYRLEKIHSDYLQYQSRSKTKQNTTIKVLVAPGWGAWGKRETLLDMCGHTLLESLLKTGLDVVLRPHHMMRKIHPDFLDTIYKNFQKYTNFSYEEDMASTASFYDADILVSDWSGVGLEFALGTEKPVLFVNVPMKVNNPHYKDFCMEPVDIALRRRIGCVLELENAHRAGEFVVELFKKRVGYIEEIIKARQELVFNFGHCSEVGARYIREQLGC